jgi:Zn-dependent alcohol dehydrogenase
VVVTAVAPHDEAEIPVNLFQLAMFQKRIQGVLYGMMSPSKDVPRLLAMYERGQLKLDELVTQTYPLDEINTGYDDLHAGRNIRGVVVFDH